TMQEQRKTRRYFAGLAMVGSCCLWVFVLTRAGENDAPKPLPPETVKAWRNADAKVGWMKTLPPLEWRGYGFLDPWCEEAEPGTLPAFKFHPSKAGEPEKLPDPGVP